MKLFWSVLLACLLMESGNAQPIIQETAIKENIAVQFKKMGACSLAQDWPEFAKYTYPPVVKMLGGRENFTTKLKGMMRSMDAQGFTFVDVQLGGISDLIYTKTTVQCTVEQIIYIKTEQGKLIQKGTLIGLSSDKGMNWTFIDTQRKPLSTFQDMFKEISSHLVIPAKEEPILVPDEEQ